MSIMMQFIILATITPEMIYVVALITRAKPRQNGGTTLEKRESVCGPMCAIPEDYVCAYLKGPNGMVFTGGRNPLYNANLTGSSGIRL
jgi:hypothetical protein